MHMQTIVAVVAGMAASASASAAIPANPILKHLAVRALNVDGSFAGLIFKRQGGCPPGYSTCGSGCSLGPCCNADAGLACRPGEVCSEVDGDMGCCPEGFVCDGMRSCQDAVGGGCTPGSVDNGVLCCDAAAPLCSTSAGTPYCAGVAPSTVITVAPYPTGGDDDGEFDSTITTSFTATLTLTETPTEVSTDTLTVVIPTEVSTDTLTVVIPTETLTEVTTDVTVVVPTFTLTEVTTEVTTDITVVIPTVTETLSETDVVSTTITDTFTIQTSTPTNAVETSTSTFTATSTATSVVVVPNPPGNGTATSTPSPPEATGAAGKLGVSGFALTIALGLAFLL